MTVFSGLAAALAAFSVTTSLAAAATISVVEFDAGSYAAQVAAGTFTGEDFESEGAAIGEREVGATLATGIGEFYSLGGTGTGGTVRNLAGNTGTELALRDGKTYGRTDTYGGRWYLDSNDTYGIGWQVSSSQLFDTVMFILTDGSDTGGFLRISVDGTSYEQRSGARLANGNSQLVTIRFDSLVSSALIELENYDSSGTNRRLNDGFSIDGAQVGTVAAIPLPPAAPFLAGGILGLAGLRRRKRAI